MSKHSKSKGKKQFSVATPKGFHPFKCKVPKGTKPAGSLVGIGEVHG